MNEQTLDFLRLFASISILLLLVAIVVAPLVLFSINGKLARILGELEKLNRRQEGQEGKAIPVTVVTRGKPAQASDAGQ